MIHPLDSVRMIMAKVKSGIGPMKRKNNEMREIKVQIDYTQNALASLVYSQGDTMVLVCVTKADSLPRWFPRDAQRGWVHAEYSLLPGSTNTRFRRERNGAKGRTMEIERLVARSLRAAIDLEELGPVALTIDCDILNADGGTRCASITAASIALRLAIRRLISSGESVPKSKRLTKEEIRKGETPVELNEQDRKDHERSVMPNDVAALSVGVVDGKVWTDLDYSLDSNADVDMNVVMTSSGQFVEVQGTGEEATYSRDELDELVDAAVTGITKIHKIQSEILSGSV
tara:strand:- start:401 stop:1261 length:861 start_codon:yes stop_codon:yes gene_type:complete